MDLFQLSAALLSLAAVFSYLNHRFLKLPTTIGLMIIAMAASLALVTLGEVFPALEARAQKELAGIDFNRTLMQGMLGFLLFAAALHINLAELSKHRVVIAFLATVGVLLSTVLVGGLAYGVPGGAHRARSALSASTRESGAAARAARETPGVLGRNGEAPSDRSLGASVYRPSPLVGDERKMAPLAEPFANVLQSSTRDRFADSQRPRKSFALRIQQVARGAPGRIRGFAASRHDCGGRS